MGYDSNSFKIQAKVRVKALVAPTNLLELKEAWLTLIKHTN